MLEQVFGPRRTRQFQRIVRNGKLLLLCLVLTIVVLRGNLGVGKFGTPEQDFNEIRETFYHVRGKRVEPRRILEEAATQTQSAGNNDAGGTNNYAAFDINKIFVDEEPEEWNDPNQPYSLGPKISNWDEQRGEWL